MRSFLAELGRTVQPKLLFDLGLIRFDYQPRVAAGRNNVRL